MEVRNSYAVGMAQAMKSTGDEPPLKKSTIKKAHEIAKAIDEAYAQGAAPNAQLKGKEKAPKTKAGRTDHPHGGRLVGETEMKRKEITEINVGGILDGLRAVKNKILKGFKPKVNKKLANYEKSVKALIFLSNVSDRRLTNALQGTGIRPSEIRNLIDNDLPTLLNADSAEISSDALIAAIERVEPMYEKIIKAKSRVQDEEFFAYLAAASIGGIIGFLASAAADERKKRKARDTELNESILSIIGGLSRLLKRGLKKAAKPGQSEKERLQELRKAISTLPFADNERTAVLQLVDMAGTGSKKQKDIARKMLFTHFGIRLGSNTGQGYRSGPQLQETIGSSSIATAIGTVGKPISRTKAYKADGTMINALDVKENDKQYGNSIRRR